MRGVAWLQPPPSTAWRFSPAVTTSLRVAVSTLTAPLLPACVCHPAPFSRKYEVVNSVTGVGQTYTDEKSVNHEALSDDTIHRLVQVRSPMDQAMIVTANGYVPNATFFGDCNPKATAIAEPEETAGVAYAVPLPQYCDDPSGFQGADGLHALQAYLADQAKKSGQKCDSTLNASIDSTRSAMSVDDLGAATEEERRRELDNKLGLGGKSPSKLDKEDKDKEDTDEEASMMGDIEPDTFKLEGKFAHMSKEAAKKMGVPTGKLVVQTNVLELAEKADKLVDYLQWHTEGSDVRTLRGYIYPLYLAAVDLMMEIDNASEDDRVSFKHRVL